MHDEAPHPSTRRQLRSADLWSPQDHWERLLAIAPPRSRAEELERILAEYVRRYGVMPEARDYLARATPREDSAGRTG